MINAIYIVLIFVWGCGLSVVIYGAYLIAPWLGAVVGGFAVMYVIGKALEGINKAIKKLEKS